MGTVIMFGLVLRLASLMLVDAGNYRNAAIDQYTYETTIPAKRGTVYDTNMKPLALSASAKNVFLSPYDIENDSQVLIIANGLAEILGVERSMIIEKCERRQSKYQMIKRLISESEEDAVKRFIEDNGFSRIVHLEETTKRYYPYGSLACHVIGMVGSENNGLTGLEYYYNEYLSGVNGKSVLGRDSHGNPLPFKYESFIDAQDGYSIQTTIDWTIQSVLEKNIKQAYMEHNPNFSVSGMVMDVHTGEILAMAIYPCFDLNNYAVLSDEYQAKLDAFEGTDEEKEKYRNELMNLMWNNTIVSQTYEPGSTFKIITGSVALEEGTINENTEFYCAGYVRVEGLTKPVHCHSIVPHGKQNFAKAIVNSCNPAFIAIGQSIGCETFKKYFERYGYTERTGVDLPGEVSSIYFGTTGSSFGNGELSIYSFGQTFKVTMVQHLRAVNTIANGGYLVTPHLVKSIIDGDGNTVKTFDYTNERQIISAYTAKTVSTALINSTKNACVTGYNVIAKTGTSEKRDTEQTDYIGSTVVFAPAEDPQVAIIVAVDDPTGSLYHGSSVAAPAISGTLSEILPYLGINPNGENIESKVTVNDYRGSSVANASLLIENSGLKVKVYGTGNTVVAQNPRMQTELPQDGVVALFTDSASQSSEITVPNLTGYSYSQAHSTLAGRNLNMAVSGIYNSQYNDAHVVSQSPAAGSTVLPGTIVELTFKYSEDIE